MDFKERYQFNVKTDLVGKGGFSKVYKAFDVVRKRQVALKFFYGDWNDKYDVIAELEKVEDLIHPNLVRYYDADIIKSTNAIGEEDQIQVGILEYVNGGDITQLLQTNDKVLLKSVITDILNGLKYLHQNEIAHRDLKPKNILLSKKEGKVAAKIADFGISKRLGFDDNKSSTQLLGSVEYMAPEQFNTEKYGINGQLSSNVDLWSFGIIIYELFTRNTPFGNRSTGLTNEQILNNILFSDIVIDFNKLEEPYRTIVRRCLVKNANDRIANADELLELLNQSVQNSTSPSPSKEVDHSATMVLPNPKKLILEQEAKLKAEHLRNEQEAKQKADEQRRKELAKQAQLAKQIVDDKSTLVLQKPAILKQQQAKLEEKQKPKQPAKPSFFSRLKKAAINRGGVPTKKAVIQNAINYNSTEVEMGKDYFKLKDFVNSYKHLNKYINHPQFDTEGKFYVGYMLYNGKCGGEHDPQLGRDLMEKAKEENRSLVMDLMVKYVLND